VLGGTPAEDPDVVLIGTGSELQLAVAARRSWRTRKSLRRWCRCRASSGSNPSRRVPRQRASAAVSARVAVEAAVAQSWYKLVGDTGEIVSIEHYGAVGRRQKGGGESRCSGESVYPGGRRGRRGTIIDN